MKKKWRSDLQTVTAFNLPKEMLTALDERAKTMGLTRSNYIRYAIARELGMFRDPPSNPPKK